MPQLSKLTEEEGRSYIHLIRNNKRLDHLQEHSGQTERELAKRVEEEKFEGKNHYRQSKLTLDFVDKTRMGLD